MNEKVIDELVVLISQSKRATSFSGGGGFPPMQK